MVGQPMPEPNKNTVWGLLKALSLKVSVANSKPATDGENEMPTAQVLLGASVELLQVSDTIVKSPASKPEMTALVMNRSAAPQFVRMSVRVDGGEWTSTVPKSNSWLT